MRGGEEWREGEGGGLRNSSLGEVRQGVSYFRSVEECWRWDLRKLWK